jgi:hypothetical protein
MDLPPVPAIELHLTQNTVSTTLTWALQDGVPGQLAGKVLPGLTAKLRRDDLGRYVLNLHSRKPLAADTDCELRLPLTVSAACVPTFDGRLEQGGPSLTGTYRGPGEAIGTEGALYLALPLTCLRITEDWWLAGTDPAFSATIRSTPEGVSFSWRLLAAAGPLGDWQRLLVLQRVADATAGLDVWCAQAAPPATRPAWLKEIALNYYDYLGDNGEAWFKDLAAMAKAIPPEQRHHAVACLHGWYDEVGTYCMKPDGTLKEKWMAFPHMAAMGVRNPGWPAGSGGPREDAYQFRIDTRLQPVAMSWSEVRRRLVYAKKLGFRTAFYAFTGLQRAGSPTAHIADGTGLEREGGIWQGPDLVGETYIANPLHPQVRRFYLDLTTKLCQRVGDLCDAFVMDEAYYVGRGQLGPAACPGYAAPAQATLIAEMTAICHSARSELAFLTADLLGAPQVDAAVFPYSLWADGIYQDSACRPSTWGAVRFPTWAATAWSCNWAPLTNLEWTRQTVALGGPVAVANGCFGDDTGFAEMPLAVQSELLALFQTRIAALRGSQAVPRTP